MAATIASSDTRPVTTHVEFRLVQPGSWQRCVQCLETIEYLPGGDRAQATAKDYDAGSVIHVEHFHAECYRALEATRDY